MSLVTRVHLLNTTVRQVLGPQVAGTPVDAMGRSAIIKKLQVLCKAKLVELFQKGISNMKVPARLRSPGRALTIPRPRTRRNRASSPPPTTRSPLASSPPHTISRSLHLRGRRRSSTKCRPAIDSRPGVSPHPHPYHRPPCARPALSPRSSMTTRRSRRGGARERPRRRRARTARRRWRRPRRPRRWSPPWTCSVASWTLVSIRWTPLSLRLLARLREGLSTRWTRVSSSCLVHRVDTGVRVVCVSCGGGGGAGGGWSRVRARLFHPPSTPPAVLASFSTHHQPS